MRNKTESTQNMEQWVYLYNNDLYTWALKKTHSKELAEDMVQETFLSSFKSIEKFKNESHPKTWLIAILNNKIIDYYRKEKNIYYQAFDDNPNNTDKLLHKNNLYYEENVNGQQENYVHLENLIVKGLNELPEKWNKALTYKYYSNRTADEICKKLQISKTNYWQIVHRAKILLRKNVEKKFQANKAITKL